MLIITECRTVCNNRLQSGFCRVKGWVSFLWCSMDHVPVVNTIEPVMSWFDADSLRHRILLNLKYKTRFEHYIGQTDIDGQRSFSLYKLIYLIRNQPSLSHFVVAVCICYQMFGLGITAGAHRLWAHRSYKAKLPLRIFLALMSCGAWQVKFLSLSYGSSIRLTNIAS